MLTRRATGLAIVGDEVIVVRASLRGSVVEWETERVGAGGRASAGGPATLAWATDACLRREVELTSQTVEEFREVAGGNLGALAPVRDVETARWDVAELRGAEGSRAWLGVIPGERLESALERLRGAGLEPARVAPSGLCYPLLRVARGLPGVEAGGSPAPAVLEETPTGWSLHGYAGASWSSCRAGSGAAPAAVLSEAERAGAARCSWGAEPGAGVLTGEHAALGAALLGMWPRLDAPGASAPTFNFLGRPARRGLTLGRFGRAAALCGLAVAGLVALASALHGRATGEIAALESAAAAIRPESERVDGLRAEAARVRAVHNALWRLETPYAPRWRTLAALSAATPDEAWVERLELTDGWFTVDAVGSSPAELIRALEDSAMFAEVKQSGGSTPTAGGGQRFRVQGRVVMEGGGT